MLSKSSKWEMGFVHNIAKFTMSRFVISKFECSSSTTTYLNSKYVPCLLGQDHFRCGQQESEKFSPEATRADR